MYVLWTEVRHCIRLDGPAGDFIVLFCGEDHGGLLEPLVFRKAPWALHAIPA